MPWLCADDSPSSIVSAWIGKNQPGSKRLTQEKFEARPARLAIAFHPAHPRESGDRNRAAAHQDFAPQQRCLATLLVEYHTAAAAAEIFRLATGASGGTRDSGPGNFLCNHLQVNVVAQAAASLALDRCVHAVKYWRSRWNLSIAQME